MTQSPDRQSGHPRRQAGISASEAEFSSARDQASKVQVLLDFEERLARELVRGLVQSAIARGADPAARLQEFRMLQQAAMAISQDPAVAQITVRLVRAIDLALQELAAVKS